MASSSLPAYKPLAISVDEDFGRRPFVLSAEAIQKIHDILISRLSGSPVFEIEYSDGTTLREAALDRIMSDENSKRRSIKEIECSFHSESKSLLDSDYITLKFGGYTPIRMTVRSPDRERVWLTVEDLRDYVSHDVAQRARFPQWMKLTAIACATAACYWALKSWGTIPAKPSVQGSSLAEVIRSVDPNVKLNYLLERQFNPVTEQVPVSIALSMFAVCMLGAWAFLHQFVEGAILPVTYFPKNHFTIGQGAQRYDKQKQLQNRLFWSVLVAFVVGVVRSVFLAQFTKP
jgi:hypothetical protein